MCRTPEHVQAAIDECSRLGASFSWNYGSKHIVGIVVYDGKQVKLFMSKTPSDWRVPLKVKCEVRRKIMALGV